MRPSGTLQSPTTGSLAEMIREADREDHIAAARSLPKDVTLQLPDAPLVKPVGETAAQNTTPANLPPPAGTLAFQPTNTVAKPAPATVQTVSQNKPAAAVATTAQNDKPAAMEELPSFVPAPKSLITDKDAANVAAVNTGNAGTQNAVLTSMPKATDAKLNTARMAQLTLVPDGDVMKVGEKRRYAIQLNSEVPLSLALLALRFDPKVVKLHGVTAGSILPTTGEVPLFTPVIDPSGTCLISISSLNGKASFKGSGPLLFIDIEAIAEGNAGLSVVKETLHLVATDARDLVPDIKQGTATVRQ
jgi:hypothetical protein